MLCVKCSTTLIDIPIISTRGIEYTPLCPKCSSKIISVIGCRNETATSAIMESRGVPKRFTSARLFESDLCFKKVSEVIAGKLGIYFLGESGVGKTTKMIGWAAHMVSLGKSIRFTDFSDFICELRSDYKQFNRLRDELLDADVLFIDNFDTSNAYIQDSVFNLVNCFYKLDKQVFFTSNFLPSQDSLAMRISDITVQIELVKGETSED